MDSVFYNNAALRITTCNPRIRNLRVVMSTFLEVSQFEFIKCIMLDSNNKISIEENRKRTSDYKLKYKVVIVSKLPLDPAITISVFYTTLLKSPTTGVYKFAVKNGFGPQWPLGASMLRFNHTFIAPQTAPFDARMISKTTVLLMCDNMIWRLVNITPKTQGLSLDLFTNILDVSISHVKTAIVTINNSTQFVTLFKTTANEYYFLTTLAADSSINRRLSNQFSTLLDSEIESPIDNPIAGLHLMRPRRHNNQPRYQLNNVTFLFAKKNQDISGHSKYMSLYFDFKDEIATTTSLAEIKV